MRMKGNHSFSDRLVRANIISTDEKVSSLTDEQLLIAICANSPNSSDITCETRDIKGKLQQRIGAVAQIMRDYPEEILFNTSCIPEMERVINIINSLPAKMKSDAINLLEDYLKINQSAQPLVGKVETRRFQDEN